MVHHLASGAPWGALSTMATPLVALLVAVITTLATRGNARASAAITRESAYAARVDKELSDLRERMEEMTARHESDRERWHDRENAYREQVTELRLRLVRAGLDGGLGGG